MLKGKKRTMFFFAIIYLVFGFALVYLLFFNTGLEFVKDADGAGLFLKNYSVHAIHNIQVLDDAGEEIAFIEELLPGQMQEISFEKKELVQLKASAPFHIPTETKFTLAGVGEELLLEYSTSYPTAVLLEQEFPVIVKVCSKKSVENVEVFPEFDKSVIEFLDKGSVFLDIKKGACKEAEFNFKALKEGETTVRFKIKALNYIKVVESSIKIFELE